MSGPFSPLAPKGLLAWSTVTTVAGNFQSITATGLGTLEVGYGMDAYSAGGYDAPSVSGQAAASPIWTIVVVK